MLGVHLSDGPKLPQPLLISDKWSEALICVQDNGIRQMTTGCVLLREAYFTTCACLKALPPTPPNDNSNGHYGAHNTLIDHRPLSNNLYRPTITRRMASQQAGYMCYLCTPCLACVHGCVIYGSYLGACSVVYVRWVLIGSWWFFSIMDTTTGKGLTACIGRPLSNLWYLSSAHVVLFILVFLDPRKRFWS